MTEIILNNTKYQKEAKNTTVEDLQNEMNNELAKKKHVITEIKVEGQEVSLDDETETVKKKVTEFESVEFKSMPRLDLAFTTLESCDQYIDQLNLRIKDLVSLYRANKIDEANALFVEVTTILDLFVQLMARIQTIFSDDLSDGYKKSESIINLEVGLLEILKQLVPARQKNDLIMLCDLLEYELTDNLVQWKTQVIPSLQSLKN